MTTPKKLEGRVIGREAGITTVIKFLQGLSASRFELIAATEQDIARIATILEQYIDSKVDFVDANVMAIAGRLNIKTILTIDQRDFRLFRPIHCENFTLHDLEGYESRKISEQRKIDRQ